VPKSSNKPGAAKPAAKPPAAKAAAKGASKSAKAPVAKAPKRPRLTGAALAAHATEVQRRLLALYPDAHCELDYRTPFELLAATILSAQCTDKRVNMVTPELFRRWPDARAMSRANPAELEEVVKSTGFYRGKAKSLLGMAQAIVAKHGGEVPSEMDQLTALPGVGRKTANVLLGNALDKNEGIVVDTHVARLSARFGFTTETDAVKIEQALMPLFARDSWAMLSHLLIWHGRRVCDARKPRCGECTLADICPSAAP
jgi:endonuclease-3